MGPYRRMFPSPQGNEGVADMVRKFDIAIDHQLPRYPLGAAADSLLIAKSLIFSIHDSLIYF